jgi:hypothetical protein
MRAKSASRSAKKSRSAEGPVGASAPAGSDPRTRAASTRTVRDSSDEELPAPLTTVTLSSSMCDIYLVGVNPFSGLRSR